MRHRNALGSLAVACVLVTAGCNDAPPDADPTASASSGEPRGTDRPSASSTPSVAPATGRLMRTSGATMNAPKGWTTVSAKTFNYLTVSSDDGLSTVTLSDFGTVTEADTEKYLRQTVRQEEPENARSEAADLGTAPGLHLSWHDDTFQNDVYGAILENTYVYVWFTQYTDLPAAERQRNIDSALASFRWK